MVRCLRALCVLVMSGVVVFGVGLSPQVTLAADQAVVGDGYACSREGLAEAIAAVASTNVKNPGLVTFQCAVPEISFTSNIVIGTSTTPLAVSIDGSNNGRPMVFDGGEVTNFIEVKAGSYLTVQNLTLRRGWTSDVGGAINVGDMGTLTAISVTFVDNHSDLFGGAIFHQGPAIISQSTFSSNNGGWGGGAIYSDGQLTLSRSRFEANEAWGGGAIEINRKGTISQSSFIGNNATFGDGGAIETYDDLTIDRSSFVANHTQYRGGAIDAWAGTLTVVSTTFANNQAVGGGSTLHVPNFGGTVSILWSTIIQPDGDGPPALALGKEITFTGVILGGNGDHCELSEDGKVVDTCTLANDSSCELEGDDSLQNINLALSPLTTAIVNGVEQTYYPFLEDSPAFDGGPATCDTAVDEDTLSDPDQLGTFRPNGSACDIGAFELMVYEPKDLCANQWNGQLRMAGGGDCGRSEMLIELPLDAPLTLCVNRSNGAARSASNCSRSERTVIVTSDGSIAICVNTWNGTLRVSDRCSRSEHADSL